MCDLFGRQSGGSRINHQTVSARGESSVCSLVYLPLSCLLLPLLSCLSEPEFDLLSMNEYYCQNLSGSK